MNVPVKTLIFAIVVTASPKVYYYNCVNLTGKAPYYIELSTPSVEESGGTCFPYNVYKIGEPSRVLDRVGIVFDTLSENFMDANIPGTQPENPWGIFDEFGEMGSFPARKGYISMKGKREGVDVYFRDIPTTEHTTFKYCFEGRINTTLTTVYLGYTDRTCTKTDILGPKF